MSVNENLLVDFFRQDEAAAELKVCWRMSEGIIPPGNREIVPLAKVHECGNSVFVTTRR